MKKNDAFPSKYLKAQDVLDEGGELAVVVNYSIEETLKNKKGEDEKKVIVYFNDIQKGLVLNLTNWNAIETVTGKDDSDHWSGESIVLETQMITAFGETRPAIRVKLSNTKPEKSGNHLELSSDFWAKIYGEMKMTKEDGERILAENDGNFKEALAVISASLEDEAPF